MDGLMMAEERELIATSFLANSFRILPPSVFGYYFFSSSLNWCSVLIIYTRRRWKYNHLYIMFVLEWYA